MKKVNFFLMMFFVSLFVSNVSNALIIDFTLALPRGCENYPSGYIYPNQSVDVKMFLRSNQGELVNYELKVEQGNISQVVGTGNFYVTNKFGGSEINLTADVSGITNLCKNKLAKLRVTIWESGFTNEQYRIGTFIIYQEANPCGFSSVTGGSSAPTHQGNITLQFVNSDGCKLATSTYYGQRHKVTFTRYGNFEGIDFEVEKSLCMGYNGANPNYQHMWGAVEEKSNNHVKFITFVYKVYNNLGQDLGWWPAPPSGAAVVYKTVQTSNVSPIISRLEQWPNPMRPDMPNANIFCILSQGSQPLSYSWAINNYSSNGFGGSYTNNSGQNWMSVWKIQSHFNNNFVPEATTTAFVSNPWGNNQKTEVLPRYSNINVSGCPTLQFASDSLIVDENTLLINSPGSPFKDVTDHYMIMNPMLSGHDMIEFKIYEPEFAYTDLDAIKLFQIAIESEHSAAVLPNGRVINYISDQSKNETSVVINGNRDATETVRYRNNEIEELYEKDEIIVSDAKLEEGREYFIVMVTKNVLNKSVAFGFYGDDYIREEPIFGRHNESIIAFPVTSTTGNVKIRIQQNLEVDQIIVVEDLESAIVMELPLLTAKHSVYGDVSGELDTTDGNFTILSNGDEIAFEYLNQKYYYLKTQYFLSLTGQYYVPHSREVPEQNENTNPKLMDNYPNPFNPITNISFQLFKNENVTIKVFDILGREIFVLVNEVRGPGHHTVSFDASKLSSGVYFYEFRTDNFRDIRKMTLLK